MSKSWPESFGKLRDLISKGLRQRRLHDSKPKLRSQMVKMIESAEYRQIQLIKKTLSGQKNVDTNQINQLGHYHD
jgi:hypothetical protein